jgi:hypothetical protein
MSFTIKATYGNQTKVILFETPAIPPHAIINAKVDPHLSKRAEKHDISRMWADWTVFASSSPGQLRDAFGLVSDAAIAWWHIYMSVDSSIPGAKFLRVSCIAS